MPSVTTEQVTEVKISNRLKAQLVKKLAIYNQNRQTMEVAEHANKKIKDDIEKLFAEAGEFGALQAGVKADGFIVRHFSPISSRFDKKKAISAGYISAAQIEECSKPTPGRPFIKINVPGEKNDADSSYSE